MNAIKETLRASKLAITLPNNYSPAETPLVQPFPRQTSDVCIAERDLIPRTQDATFQPSSIALESKGILCPLPIQLPVSAAGQSTSAMDCHPPSSHTPASPPFTTTTSTAPSLSLPLPKPLNSALNYPPLRTPLPPPFTISTAPSQLQTKPVTKEHKAEICKCLYPLRAKWKTIGTFLCVDHNILAAIKAESEDTGEMLMGMIAEWLQQLNPPPTWQALAEAVQYISPEKADEIRQIFHLY